jgi:hypothetical protein
VRHWPAAVKQDSGDNAPATPPRRDGSVIPNPFIMRRDVGPCHGWTEPERRKYRDRIEDVEFD